MKMWQFYLILAHLDAILSYLVNFSFGVAVFVILAVINFILGITFAIIEVKKT